MAVCGNCAPTPSEYQTKPAPWVAVSALWRAHIGLQSSVARHPAPRAPAGPRHGHAGRGLHHGDRDQDQRLPRHRQDRERPTKYDGDQCVRPLYLCAIITGIHTSECWHYGGPNTFMYSYSAFVFIHRCLSASRDNFRYAFTDCLQTHCNTEVSFRHAQAYFITD